MHNERQYTLYCYQYSKELMEARSIEYFRQNLWTVLPPFIKGGKQKKKVIKLILFLR